MGARGPKPKTAEERALTGVRSRRGGGASAGELPENRPMRPAGEIVAPAYLSPAALPYWTEVVGWVSQMGLAWPCDAIVLAQIAELLHVQVELTKLTWGRGVKSVWTLQRDGNGTAIGIHANGQVKELREIRRELNSLLEQVGLTPAARTRLRVIPPPASIPQPTDVPANVPKTAAGNYDFAATVAGGASLRMPLPLTTETSESAPA
mgnify:CR=1 FL=1